MKNRCIATGTLTMKKTIMGFTLAEVLITLTVVGVIAALTIPSLIQNIQDAQFHTAWRKAYSDMAQATLRIATDNGGSLKDVCTDASTNYWCLRDLYLQYLPFVKKCKDGIINGCQYDSYKQLNGTSVSSANGPSAILNNGSLVIFGALDYTCSRTSGPNVSNVCGYLYVDVNGWNGPNTIGRDIYYIWVSANSIKPEGTTGDSYDGTCVPNGDNWWGSGVGCSAKYLQQ